VIRLASVAYRSMHCPNLHTECGVFPQQEVLLSYGIIRGVQNPMIENFGYRFSKNRSEPTSKFKNRKLSFCGSVFKNRLWQFGDVFSRCLIHNSSCSMIGSTVTVFFFIPYLCTSNSESLPLTISWTNSARKYVISSVIRIKQHTVQKPKLRLI